MKHLIKTIVLGVAAFVAVRFVMRVGIDDKPISDAAKESLAGPVELLGTTLGLALQPAKWGQAKEIMRRAAVDAKGENREDIARISQIAYADLVALNKVVPQPAGAEKAQH